MEDPDFATAKKLIREEKVKNFTLNRKRCLIDHEERVRKVVPKNQCKKTHQETHGVLFVGHPSARKLHLHLSK